MALVDRTTLLDAFDAIGAAAADAGQMLDILVYGGSALMLASNFRFASEDVDIAAIERPWPAWLEAAVAAVAARYGWPRDWLSDAVQAHLSPLADRAADHAAFGTFPRGGAPGLRVSVPTAEYLLALKLKAMRINDPVKGPQERSDIVNLLAVTGTRSIDAAIDVLARYFPRSATDAGKQRFLLRQLWPEVECAATGGGGDAPAYPARGLR